MGSAVEQSSLFSSCIASIKEYSGDDPLDPWIQGIKKIKKSLPHSIVMEKLPRFLQKCAYAFESDARYQKDLRYIRIWVHLMDFVDDPKILLRRMEVNKIGTRHALFYQAYALYYEKYKKFEEAAKMYLKGANIHAEPFEELCSSYQKFLVRMDAYRRQKIKKLDKRCLLTEPANDIKNEMNIRVPGESCSRETENELISCSMDASWFTNSKTFTLQHRRTKIGSENPSSAALDDTVVVKFIGSTITGGSEQEREAACHHGLVDPTINTKEAMSDINSMFQEPVDATFKRRPKQTLSNKDRPVTKEFEVFVDESAENTTNKSSETKEGFNHRCGLQVSEPQPLQAPPIIFIVDKGENPGKEDVRGSSYRRRLQDDTVVCRFVESTVLGQPDVENPFHHGLVDPTVNMKEALDDINCMFGKTLEFANISRAIKLQTRNPVEENAALAVFVDDDLNQQEAAIGESQENEAIGGRQENGDHSLFEQTLCTKEALEDINRMFGQPLDL